MTTREYVCTKITHNKHLGAECWQNNMIFLFDEDGIIKVGDKVKIQRDPYHSYRKIRIWINGEELINDD